MIKLGDETYAFSDPRVLAALGGVLLVVFLLWLLITATRRAGRAADAAAQISEVTRLVGALAEGQHRLDGRISSVSESQANGQAQIVAAMESRLAEVQAQVADRLHQTALHSARTLNDMQEKVTETLSGSSKATATSLTQLTERLAQIDKAQANIEKLSGDVLGLQDILSNKQTRGAFGEIQLNDIVSKALPRDSYTLQASLSNGRRADCLIHLPKPPGPIVIDAKFPLEAYEQLRAASTDAEKTQAARALRTAVKAHISTISERYIVEGETADGALMFLPSEAVYAELHANFAEVVREGFAARVWIVSPTTCMATLNTMRAVLKDARMREQAGAIRKELALLYADVDRLGTRVGNLDRHFGQAAKDIEEIKISADKAGKRAHRLDAFDFEELAPEEEPRVVPLGSPSR
ncbi:DNA recombination protein RmuC [Vannielia litorea]|uniref:DNA recombination protein RmuC homolog n=1 Tax=Vannielia litorea TaxID=1217970 RepID=A0A1N6H9S0_9RHOB|nr:DNA recombination protein RmuC [Vannielia litorea]SIO16522.1 DNA recombination protein RmuC [Vannielia litorea]